jgi:hypothetical protein
MDGSRLDSIHASHCRKGETRICLALRLAYRCTPGIRRRPRQVRRQTSGVRLTRGKRAKGRLGGTVGNPGARRRQRPIGTAGHFACRAARPVTSWPGRSPSATATISDGSQRCWRRGGNENGRCSLMQSATKRQRADRGLAENPQGNGHHCSDHLSDPARYFSLRSWQEH